MAKQRKKSLASRKRVPTTERLAKALEDLNDPRLDDMVKKARKGYYDDYKTTIPAPIVQLAYDFDQLGYHAMAERARDGEWDTRPWEGREWFEKEGKGLLADSSLFRGGGR